MFYANPDFEVTTPMKIAPGSTQRPFAGRSNGSSPGSKTVAACAWNSNGAWPRAPPSSDSPAPASCQTVGGIDSTFVETSFGGEGTAVNGCKRATGANLHLIIEKYSRVLGAIVLPANLQDALGARLLLPGGVKERFPTITTIFGDGAHRQEPLKEFAASSASTSMQTRPAAIALAR